MMRCFSRSLFLKWTAGSWQYCLLYILVFSLFIGGCIPEHINLPVRPDTEITDEEEVTPDKETVTTDKTSYDAVDLGLSVKWASCNMGASSPEDYGDYYAWGEIKVKNDYWNDTYSCNYTGNDVSGTEYDVAHVIWGGDWRMPTKNEVIELCDECSWQWTVVNGINGQKVTGPNGNSIFLPAAGARGAYGTDIKLATCGFYWSSTRYDDYDYNAYCIHFSNIAHDWYDPYRRWYGYTIRPVKR